MNILMIVTGDYTHDTRVCHEKDALVSEGYNVTVADWRHSSQNKILTMVSMIIWGIKTYRQCLKQDFDVVHCHDFDTLFIGVLLKKKTGCRLVYDSHEMYAFMTGIWLVLVFEKLFLGNVDRCIAVSTTVKEYLKELGASDIVCVRNCKPLISKEYISPPCRNGLFVSYFGSLSSLRMFPVLVDIFGGLPDVTFVVGGYGILSDVVRDRCGRYNNTEYLGWIPEEKVMEYTGLSDLVICMLNPGNRNCVLGMPNKLYECLVAGRPLMVTDNTYVASIVKELGVGFTVGYSARGIQGCLLKIMMDEISCEELGRNALRHAVESFNWDVEKKYLLNLYGGLL